jgi:WD40 repeat protein
MKSVALSAHGRLAVSASHDTIKVWRVATSLELRTIEKHRGDLLKVALSADRWLAVSATNDYTLKVWNVITGRELHKLKGHRRRITCMALSANGRLAVSASYDRTLKVWDVAKGRELRTLKGHKEKVNCVALSTDGRLVVTASGDEHNKPGRFKTEEVYDKPAELKVWEVMTGRELYTLQGHSDSVYGVVLSADGRLVVSASYDKTLKVWEVETGQILSTLAIGAPFLCCAITPDGRTIVAGDSLGVVHFLEFVGWDEIQAPKTAQNKEEIETRPGWWQRWLKYLLRRRRR